MEGDAEWGKIDDFTEGAFRLAILFSAFFYVNCNKAVC